MNKEIIDQLVPILEKVNEGIVIGSEIVQRELPELVRQVLAFELTISWCGIALGVFLIVVGIVLVVLDEVNEWCGSGMVPGWGCVAGGLVAICVAIWKIVFISVAPKLFLLKYIGSLIK